MKGMKGMKGMRGMRGNYAVKIVILFCVGYWVSCWMLGDAFNLQEKVENSFKTLE
jgi:hypothetical protein